MYQVTTPRRPFTVDAAEYPFADHWFAYDDGYVHYIDEGQGPAILLLHGNPTWSYLYRHVVTELRSECRLIAPDYPGFGFSKAPTRYRFTPREHAKAIAALIAHLQLSHFILVVQDWGGPIGLNYAVQNRDNVRGLVVMNSWAWPASVPQKLFSLVMGGWPVGYWLQTRRNFFARSIVPRGIHHKERLTTSLRDAYTNPFPTPSSRIPTWVFPRHIRKSREWLSQIEARLSNLADVPVQILWGDQDKPGFRPIEMQRWQRHLPQHETEVLQDASHFVQEDRPDRLIAAIRRVIARTSNIARS
jgi:haloalkane dehalogenase